MIQRIQTIYLLLVAILIGTFYFFPFASFVIEQDMSICHLSISGLIPDASGAKPLFLVKPVIILLSLILLVDIVAIALYKRRMLQIKICIASIVLLVGLQGLLYYYINVAGHQLGSAPSYKLIFVFPLISAVLTYLAIRGIAKDEALIRSLDRLR